MQNYKQIEMIVGVFVLVGIMSISWMAIKLGGIGGVGDDGYELVAVFSDAGGVREGSDVLLAGVPIGKVTSVALKNNEKAEMRLMINKGVLIPNDSTASVRTKGLIGEKFVRVNQGIEYEYLANGDEFDDTESPLDLEDLIGKYIFSGDAK